MAADSAVAAPRAPPGDFRLVFRAVEAPDALPCWLAVPEHADPAARPLVAIHGIRRGAKEQAALFGARGAALGRHVIAPLFDTDNWPTYQRLGRTRRADLALLRLLQQLQNERGVQHARVDLFGFSGGAQFAHRFAMLHPQRVGRLNVAAAGWYTFPDAAAYPYGLGERSARPDNLGPQMRAALDDFLRLPIRVCVGVRDNAPGPTLRGGKAIDLQQGRDRRARASRWTETLAAAASARGIVPRIALSVLPGCGHSFRRCIAHGGLADLVLPDRDENALSLETPVRDAEALRHRSAAGDLVTMR